MELKDITCAVCGHSAARHSATSHVLGCLEPSKGHPRAALPCSKLQVEILLDFINTKHTILQALEAEGWTKVLGALTDEAAAEEAIAQRDLDSGVSLRASQGAVDYWREIIGCLDSAHASSEYLFPKKEV